MRYLGFDLGTRTLGISMSDFTNTIASTYKTIRFEERKYDSLIPEIRQISYGKIALHATISTPLYTTYTLWRVVCPMLSFTFTVLA